MMVQIKVGIMVPRIRTFKNLNNKFKRKGAALHLFTLFIQKTVHWFEVHNRESVEMIVEFEAIRWNSIKLLKAKSFLIIYYFKPF
jgi:hypothetical protein